MTTSIKDLAPQSVWRNFYLLTQVPRPSGHLAAVQQFLLDWAAERGIEAFKDNAENIVMRKPATPGMENRKVAVLQAHMDMVPQKLDESTHNFETDPIETYIDGDWVKAKGTTLGADDGIGVAAIMAVLEATDLVHGPLEALITADEETCMYGVNHLAEDTLKGDILLNIDNETMGEFVIGSAGGVNISATMQYKEVEPEEGDVAVKVTLKNLRGGHSGLEINQGRANANKLMARFVRQAIADDEARLASWSGGNMRNAIPRTAQVVLTVPAENLEDLKDMQPSAEGLTAAEYAKALSNYNSKVRRNRGGLERAEDVKQNPTLQMQSHTVQIGDVAFATIRFETYIDFMHRLQARSPFLQTFVIQMAGAEHASYLATQRGMEAKGYSASMFCNMVSADGGQQWVENQLAVLNEMKAMEE